MILNAQGEPVSKPEKSIDPRVCQAILDEIATLIGIEGSFIPSDIPVKLRQRIKEMDEEINRLNEEIDYLEQCLKF